MDLWVAAGLRELTLFAATGFLIGGLDELAVDLVWIARRVRRWLPPYYARVDAGTLAPAETPGRLAVFVPAWDEGLVIGPMLATTLRRFGDADVRLYVGCYPNDPVTRTVVAATAAGDGRVRQVVCTRPGPTTKADCLNHLWRALCADEAAEGWSAKAVVLHDAEDVVHWAEPRVFDRLIPRFDMVQLPVLPMIDRGSRWIAGSYADAFAEAHGRTLPVREAIGAGLPLAGVGCAIARPALARIAAENGGDPFDARSLTEDYELGLRVAQAGGRGCFVRLPGQGRVGWVAVREHFPDTIDAAATQKARWIAGIALDGWDRLGWSGGLAERWMRLRDRRAPLAAAVLLAGYLATLGWAVALPLGLPGPAPWLRGLLWVNGALLAWRVAVRMGFVAAAYGWREGLRAGPRVLVGNMIDLLAAWRALGRYARARRAGTTPRWDKTAHRFPEAAALE